MKAVEAINAVMADVREIGKARANQQQGYKFRGIDDFYQAYHGPMAKHGLVIVPVRVDDYTIEERATKNGGVMRFVTMTVTYRIYGPEGDHIEAQVRGEAQDSADKATNKAMSAAQKYLFMQVFVPPVEGMEDADGETHELAPREDTGGFGTRGEWTDTANRLAAAVKTAGLNDQVKALGLAWPWRKDDCTKVEQLLADGVPADPLAAYSEEAF